MCSIILHTRWQTHHYLGFLFTTAPLDVLVAAINSVKKMDYSSSSSARQPVFYGKSRCDCASCNLKGEEGKEEEKRQGGAAGVQSSQM